MILTKQCTICESEYRTFSQSAEQYFDTGTMEQRSSRSSFSSKKSTSLWVVQTAGRVKLDRMWQIDIARQLAWHGLERYRLDSVLWSVLLLLCLAFFQPAHWVTIYHVIFCIFVTALRHYCTTVCFLFRLVCLDRVAFESPLDRLGHPANTKSDTEQERRIHYEQRYAGQHEARREYLPDHEMPPEMR